MRRICRLSPSVVTKIAAGEVIERPASVVKELLENSVDAGSRRIDIEIEQGGADLIRVVDDGCGISRDDLSLAFASHATSKLKDADDLFRIATMGFRGEALASIGGVARVTLQSRLTAELAGAELSCTGGELGPLRDWNGSPGTRIEVRQLFYNTPVRRKFLRTPATEMGHISETFTRLALAHPELHLTLRHNGKDVFEVPGSLGLLDRLGLFFGQEVKDRLYAVEHEQGPARLTGYIGDPACERGNGRMQYLFINRRWFRDRGLQHALQEAYRGLLMTGRYAVAFLFLELPADQVDVNVHPTKSEVRFRDGGALHSFMLHAVRRRLQAANLTARLHAPPPLSSPSSGNQPDLPRWLEPRAFDGPGSLFSKPAFPEPPRALHGDSGNGDGPAPPIARHAAAASEHFQPHGEAVLFPPAVPKAIQLYDAYLVLETPEGMLVIDQHALHERIIFEQLKSRIRSGTLECQRLLVPAPVELTAEQASRVLEQRDALAELGLGIEDFGGGTVLLTGYPAMLCRRPPVEILKTVVDFLGGRDRLPSREQLFTDLLSRMACHAAVRAGDPLTPEEIAALLAQRDLVDDTHHCPHGRPTALLFSRHELDRQFRRV